MNLKALNMKVMFRILISCIIILFFSNIAIADQNDPRLNNLFKKLRITFKDKSRLPNALRNNLKGYIHCNSRT